MPTDQSVRRLWRYSQSVQRLNDHAEALAEALRRQFGRAARRAVVEAAVGAVRAYAPRVGIVDRKVSRSTRANSKWMLVQFDEQDPREQGPSVDLSAERRWTGCGKYRSLSDSMPGCPTACRCSADRWILAGGNRAGPVPGPGGERRGDEAHGGRGDIRDRLRFGLRITGAVTRSAKLRSTIPPELRAVTVTAVSPAVAVSIDRTPVPGRSSPPRRSRIGEPRAGKGEGGGHRLQAGARREGPVGQVGDHQRRRPGDGEPGGLARAEPMRFVAVTRQLRPVRSSAASGW